MRPAFGAHHPLSTGRQAAVVELAMALGWLTAEQIATAPLPDADALAVFHDRAYLAALERVSATGSATPDDRKRFNLGTMECPVFPGVWERARASVGGAILAADLALGGQIGFHPAGGTHHGRRDRASGFCYLADPVFAVQHLLDAGIARVAYLDLDAHHGDGVEAAFTADPRVGLFSIHEAARWPGSGQTSRADGRITNIVVPRGCGDAVFDRVCREQLQPWLDTWARDAVVVTLGADALAGDPLSSMGLSNGCLLAATEVAVAGAGRAVILGGGGYNPWTTVRLWVGLWGRLNGWRAQAPLPPAAQAVLAALSSDLVDDEARDPAWTSRLDDPPFSAVSTKYQTE